MLAGISSPPLFLIDEQRKEIKINITKKRKKIRRVKFMVLKDELNDSDHYFWKFHVFSNFRRERCVCGRRVLIY